MTTDDEHTESPDLPAATDGAGPDAPELEPLGVSELRLADGGLWAIRSTSSTVYFLDADLSLLKRERGQGSLESPRGDFDNVWVPLVDVESSRGDHGVVRVGDKHRFLTDPHGGVFDYRFWVPRTCARIDAVTRADTSGTERSDD